jgi:hypothetical protein
MEMRNSSDGSGWRASRHFFLSFFVSFLFSFFLREGMGMFENQELED